MAEEAGTEKQGLRRSAVQTVVRWLWLRNGRRGPGPWKCRWLGIHQWSNPYADIRDDVRRCDLCSRVTFL